MSLRILLDGKPCGILFLSSESAQEYIERHPPTLQQRLTCRRTHDGTKNGEPRTRPAKNGESR